MRQNVIFLNPGFGKITTFRHFLPVAKIPVISKSGPGATKNDGVVKTVKISVRVVKIMKNCQNQCVMMRQIDDFVKTAEWVTLQW